MGSLHAGEAVRIMAEERLDTLSGKTTILNSAWEGFILSLESGSGGLANFFKGSVELLTDMLGGLTLITKSVKDIEEDAKKGALKNSFEETNKEVDALAAKLGGNHKRALELTIESYEKLWGEEAQKQVVELQTQLAELGNVTEDVIEPTSELVIENNSLIKTQNELLKQAKLLPEATIAEIAAKNEKIKSIQNEIKFLNELNYLSIQRGTIEKMIAQESTVIVQTKLEENEMLKLMESTNEEDEIARAQRFTTRSQVEQEDRQKAHEKRLNAINQIGEVTNLIEDALNAKAQRDTQNKLTLIRNSADTEIDILQNKLDKGILTEEEFSTQKNTIDQKRADDELKIQKEAFNKKKKLDTIFASLEFAKELIALASAAASNPTNGVTYGGAGAAQYAATAAIAAARYGLNLGVIQSQQFADGGVLKGKSHAQGGIPFSVGGQTGFEAEGGEAIINKRSTSAFAPLLSAINQAGGGVAFANGGIAKRFASGGVPSMPSLAGIQNQIAQSGQEGMIDAINDRFDRLEVVNVASKTIGTAKQVLNIQQEASF